MSPLKVMLVLRAYAFSQPNGDLPVGQAYAPAMECAVRDLVAEGVFEPGITTEKLRVGIPVGSLDGPGYLTLKGVKLACRLTMVEP